MLQQNQRSLHQCETAAHRTRPVFHAVCDIKLHTYCPLPQLASHSPTALHQPTQAQIL